MCVHRSHIRSIPRLRDTTERASIPKLHLPTGGSKNMKKLLLVALVASTMILPASGKAPGNIAKALDATAPGAPTYQQLRSFGTPSQGSYLLGQLVRGTDGLLYGTTASGGRNDYGTVFKLKPDGTGFSLLEEFDEFTTGGIPYAGLIQGTDGSLYGTTSEGGSSGYGTVFKLKSDGTGFTVLKSFDDTTTGSFLYAGLMQGTDGALYGTANAGGSSDYGTVFRLNPDGSGFTVLKNFDNITSGAYPTAGLMQGTDGALYGTASSGGSLGYGTAFKLNPDGSGFTELLNFDDVTAGSYPYGGLMEGTDGALYGTAAYGGNAGGYGTVFRLNRDGSGFSVLKNLDSLSTGTYIRAGLMQGTGGALYGTTLGGGSGDEGTVFRLNPDGTNFAILQNFDDVTTGGVLDAGLVQWPDGALYGTAYLGGSGGSGTVFKLNPDGSGFTVLNNFFPYPDVREGGGSPTAGLIQGSDGALYGTAVSGGNGGGAGYGTVFKLNPDGTDYTVLHNFDSVTTGSAPYGRLMQGTDGALYGTANGGGGTGYGTVFRLNPDGSGFTVLKNFDNITSGAYPYAGLMQGTDGALYGTAAYGGSLGSGTVFRVNPDGSGFTVLKNLDEEATGGSPYAELIQGTDGALYGTAASGGSFTYGTLFKLNPDGSGFTVLQNFDDPTGSSPYGRLIQGTDSVLYGTAYYLGGPGGVGTVFKLNPDGTNFTVLLSFEYLTTGGEVFAGLTQGPDGVLYGTATAGGSKGYGTVFRLNPDGTGFDVLLNLDNVTTGGEPEGNLMWGADGSLYGTTLQGGDFGGGTVFRLVFNPCLGKADGTACDDGNPCTFADACVGGGTGSPVCTGTSVNCDDGIACTIDSCDVLTGACINLEGSEVPDVQFTNATTINWPTIAGATSYNTYRGTIPQSGLGSPPTAAPHYDQTCFEAGDILGDGLTVSTDPAVPPVDTAFYYQVSEVTGCGEGPIGTDSNGSLIPNTNPCLVP
jgi:uncharacterized repeat protein (TIGR03803 family)